MIDHTIALIGTKTTEADLLEESSTDTDFHPHS